MAAIEVLEADITTLDVDAIANAANTQFKHAGEACLRASLRLRPGPTV